MTRVRLYPHRTVGSESVEVHWWMKVDGQRLPCEPVRTKWDYDQDLVLGMSLSLDAGDMVEQAGIQDMGCLAAVFQVDCKSAQSRFIEVAPLFAEGGQWQSEASVVIPPGSVAQSLRLSAHVVMVREPDRKTGERIASRPGSRIVTGPTTTVFLEGDAGRFPVEGASFEELGLRSAPWTVTLVFESLADSFLGAVRFVVNTDHPVGQQALNPDSSVRFAGAMTADLVRLLVARLSGEESAQGDLEEGSLGLVVDTMCDTYLGCSFEEASELYRQDPIGFESLLQQQIDPLRSLSQ